MVEVCFFLKEKSLNQPSSENKSERKSAKWSKSEEEALLQMRSQGLDFELIASRLGKTKDSVYAKWRRLTRKKTHSEPKENNIRKEESKAKSENGLFKEFLSALNLLFPNHKRACLLLIRELEKMVRKV